MSLAKVSLQVGSKAAGHAVGSLLSSRGDEALQAARLKSLLTSQLEVLSRELGQLKGSVMKIGQVLSIYGEHLLPPEANAALKALQSQSPPLVWSEIEKVLQAELGPEKLALLEIDPVSIASASLGQVHRARRRSSQGDWEIALKIQYPGVARAIDGDLKTLRYLLSVTKLIPKGPRYDAIFNEIREMLYQEVDYAQELRATEEFRELLKPYPRYVVPEVFPEFSSPRVLATRLENGVAVDGPEAAALSQERRNAIGAAALELYLLELCRFGRMQTDPHFGNYRIRIADLDSDPDALDQIVLLDFGAVKHFDPRFLQSYAWLSSGALYGQPEWIERGARELGFLRPEDSEEQRRMFVDFCYLFGEPFSKGVPYDFARSDLPKRAARDGAQLALSFKLREPPPEVVFLDRKMGGAFVFLSALRVKADLRTMMEKYIKPAPA